VVGGVAVIVSNNIISNARRQNVTTTATD
jgi:hypothetical protein